MVLSEVDLSKLRQSRLVSRYNRIVRSFSRDCAGGGSFGFDWPTMGVLFPDRVAECRRIRAEARRRRDLGRWK